VVVDNASDQKTRSSLAAAAEKHPSLRLILSETNRGFAGGMNLGMRQARGDVFILLNSDTIVPPGAIARIADTIRSRPEIGLLGPVSNAAGNEQGIFTKRTRPQDVIAEGIEFANAAHARSPIPAYRLDFCCVALRRDAYETVGELDEDFGRGYYEDFDYSLRVRNAGLDLAILEDAFIYHQGSASFKELGNETRNLIARNKALLLGKHGRDVRFPHSRDANLSVLNQYLRMSQEGQPPPPYRILNRLTLAKADRPRSWWKRWRHARRVAQVERSLRNLHSGPALGQ
jgi:GT2 family glycosyltransferase